MPAADRILTDALGLALGEVVAEHRHAVALALAETRTAVAELQARVTGIEADVHDRCRRAARRVIEAALAELPRPAAEGAPGATPQLDELVAEHRQAMALQQAEARATIAELQSTIAGLEARCAGLEAAVLARADAAISTAIAGLRQPADGHSVTLEEVEPLVREAVGRAVAAIPPAPPGPAGQLPLVVEWFAGVWYQADVVTCDGATWQARRDTGERPAPDSEDWLCLAAAGHDGADGRSFATRGLWSAEERYRALDVVALNGASFIASCDDPGPCPGDGWRLLAARGKTGKPGEPGRPGLPGTPGRAPTVEELGPLIETVVGRMLAMGVGR